MPTFDELNSDLAACSAEMDEALRTHREAGIKYAKAKAAFKKKYAEVATATPGSVKNKEWLADIDTADLLEAYLIAEVMEKNALEWVRNARQDMNALQTQNASLREELKVLNTPEPKR